MYKLLIVDDEPLTRHYFKMNAHLMHPEWICAAEADDGAEALKLLDRGESFDLIVTDIRMPGMSGLELARRLSTRPTRPRVVILSGYDEFSLAKEAMHYGVYDYLLKPIVKEEIIAVLTKTADRLSADRADEAAYCTLLSLSSESGHQITRNFLRAVVSDNDMEIKVLYPLLFRMKIGLLEAEGAIMIVDLDESQLLERDISNRHLSLYRYIVHQTAAELTAASSGIYPFIDNEERTVFLVCGDDAADTHHRCGRLYDELARTVLAMTKMHLWGAVGSSELDVLQLGASYRNAVSALKYRLFAEPERPFTLFAADDEKDARSQRLDKAVASLHAAIADNDERHLHAELQSIASEVAPLDRRRLLDLGTYILGWPNVGYSEETMKKPVDGALRKMKQLVLPNADSYSREEAVTFYHRMLDGLRDAERDQNLPEAIGVNENEIVTKVKAYILAKFSEPLSLAHIAEMMGVTPSYLSSLFHQNTQESYIKFLTRVRMEHAASLLRLKPAEKVYDVAEKVGYLSVKHFSYVFKQYFGIPPGE